MTRTEAVVALVATPVVADSVVILAVALAAVKVAEGSVVHQAVVDSVVRTVMKALVLAVEADSVAIEMIETSKTYLRCTSVDFLMVPMKMGSKSASIVNVSPNSSKSCQIVKQEHQSLATSSSIPKMIWKKHCQKPTKSMVKASSQK